MKRSFEMYSDLELVAYYKETGNVKAIDVLFERYHHLVFGVCLNYLKATAEAEDATMEVFEELMDKLLRYEVKNFKSWLHVCTKNHCLIKLRKAVVNVPLHSETDLRFATEQNYSDNEWLNWLSKMFVNLFQMLSSEQKLCLELFYFQECNYKEIAEKTGFDIKKVKSALQNGKRKLKILWLETNGEYQ